MLLFDKDVVQFTYVQKSHLKTSIVLTNGNDQCVYYKVFYQQANQFKITQPKYYLIKQDKGTIRPKQSITVDITLHKDGVATSASDKIKCFYSFHDSPLIDQPQNYQRRSDTKTHKITIKVNGLPIGFEKVPAQMKSSEVKSVYKSASQFGKNSSQDSLTLQRQIQQKEEQIVKIKNQMSTIKSTLQRNTVVQKKQPASALAVWAIAGLVLGGILSVYFY